MVRTFAKLAIGSLTVLAIASAVVVTYWSYTAGGAPLRAGFYALISITLLAIISLPFLWRSHGAGFAGTIGVGVWALFNTLFGVIEIFGGTLSLEGSMIVTALLVISIVVIVSGAAAWRGRNKWMSLHQREDSRTL